MEQTTEISNVDMMIAVDEGDLEKIQLGLNAGLKIEEGSWSWLTYAVSVNKTDVVNFLITKGADVNHAPTYTSSPLGKAAERGNVEIAKILLAHGAKMDQIQGYEDLTPLHKAARAGHLEIVKLFLMNGADVNLSSGGPIPVKPIVCAADDGHTELVKFLANNGANLKTFDPTVNDIPLFAAAMTSVLISAIGSKDQSMIDFLISKGADPNLGLTSLHLEAIQGKSSQDAASSWNVKDVNTDDAIGMKPIHYAILLDHDDVINSLFKNGADLNAPLKPLYNYFLTPLQLAVSEASVKSALFLLEHGANVNGVDNDGKSALHFVMGKEGAQVTDMIELLISHGADVNLVDNSGGSPLHRAAYYHDHNAIKILISHGADPSIKNKMGQDAFDIAKLYLDTQSMDALLGKTAQAEVSLTLEDVFAQESDFMPQLERAPVHQEYTHPELNISSGVEYY